MRHRRPAQRRQIHPLQRPDQGRHRRGQLSVLHHRTERRHRRSTGPAHGPAGGHRQAAEDAAGHRRVRRHRRPGRRRLQGRRPGQPVPRQHPRNRCHRACRALLRRRQRGARLRRRRSAARHRNHRHRTGAGRHGDRRKGAQPLPPPGQFRRQGSQDPRRRARKVLRPARPGQGRCAPSTCPRKNGPASSPSA